MPPPRGGKVMHQKSAAERPSHLWPVLAATSHSWPVFAAIEAFLTKGWLNNDARADEGLRILRVMANNGTLYIEATFTLKLSRIYAELPLYQTFLALLPHTRSFSAQG